MAIEKTPYGSTPSGRTIDLYTLSAGAMRASLITYGATLIGLETPDRSGRTADVTLGHATVEGWLKNQGFFGATVGRYGNRIAKGRFTLDGKNYVLATNNGENHLHGGVVGFTKKLWTAEPVASADGEAVRFAYTSPDGEEGYPGNLAATVVYTLTQAGELRIEMTATTDKPTVINLVNHTYWNLAGSGDCLNHMLMLSADRYTVVGAGLIPTGEIADVRGTPLDFTAPTRIGERIGQVEGGYDHNFVVRGTAGEVRLAARADDPASGRALELHTDQPGVQFYSGNFLASVPGRGGAVYGKHAGFCLETQRFPDSPNHENFPSAVLRPGQTYRHTMILKFSAK